MDILYDLIKGNSGSIIGIVGILIGFLLWVKSRRSKKLAYLIRTIRITETEERISKLRIMYENEIIKAFSLSRIALFNDGNEVIDSSIMSKKDPLKIIISESFQILDINFLYIKNKANDFSLVKYKEKNIIGIYFDYMNEGDGCIIEIFHDGASSSDISIAGSFKGIKRISQLEMEGRSRDEIHLYLALISILLGCALVNRVINLQPSLIFALAIIIFFIYGFLYSRYIKRFLICNTEFFESKM
jgi:hypothetical protein